MTRPSFAYVFAGLPAADFETSLAWYERFFGRRPDRFPHDQEAVWHLTDTGLVYVVGDRDRAGQGRIALMVEDLDRWIAEVVARGIAPGDVETLSGGVRTTILRDPDGNEITIGQVP